MPVVSVIIPAYNARRWLPETLESVVTQRVADLECIIIDDGSTDDTASYVRAEWTEFRLVSTENRGVSHARNLGTSLASGDLIQYLDADDVLLPGKITRQMEILKAHPEADVVYSNWQKLKQSPDGTFERGETMRRSYTEVHPDPEIAFFSTMWCPTGAYLYRRNFLEKILPWKEWLPIIQDARFAFDAAAAGARWLYDAEISVLYRQHVGDSISTRSRIAFLKDCQASTEDIRAIWAKRGSLTGDQWRVLRDSYAHLARGYNDLDHERFEQVVECLLELDPTYHPPGALGWMSRLIGYRHAERLASGYRKAFAKK